MMDAMMLLGEVERPVRVEVPVVLQGAEFQDGLGAVDAPPGAGDVETIADQVPACAFHHPCRDWPSRGQRQVEGGGDDLVRAAGDRAGQPLGGRVRAAPHLALAAAPAGHGYY